MVVRRSLHTQAAIRWVAVKCVNCWKNSRIWGGVGIEVVTGSHTPEQYPQYAKLAQKFGLLSSRGSDFHAPGEGYRDIGRLPALPELCTPIWHDWVGC